jgi:hypothetical protein
VPPKILVVFGLAPQLPVDRRNQIMGHRFAQDTTKGNQNNG